MIRIEDLARLKMVSSTRDDWGQQHDLNDALGDLLGQAIHAISTIDDRLASLDRAIESTRDIQDVEVGKLQAEINHLKAHLRGAGS